MDAIRPDRASRWRTPSTGRQAPRRPPLLARRHALCRVSRRRTHPSAALPGGRAGLRRRKPGAAPTPPRRRSSCCIAPRWCTTICRASTMPTRGAARPPCTRRSASPSRCSPGDALIVLAFQALARAAAAIATRLVALVGIVARAVGAPHGIIAGQAWECEPRVALADYQRAKTGALFAARPCRGGRGGRRCRPWRALGERSARPTRLPTTSATWFATPRNRQAGRPGRSARPPNAVRRVGYRRRQAQLEALVECARSTRSPPARAPRICARISGRDAAVSSPDSARRRPEHGRRLACTLAERFARPATAALATPRFQRWAAPSRSPADRAAGARARCSICAPASCTRRSCSPACASSCSSCWRSGPRPARALAAVVCRRRGGAAARGRGSLRARSARRPGPLRLGDRARRWSAIPRSAPWWSITVCSTPICAIPSRCCAASGDRTRAILALRRPAPPRRRAGAEPTSATRTTAT